MKKTLFIIIVLTAINIFSQDKPSNKQPIIYLDAFVGVFAESNNNTGLTAGAELNFQYKNNLFSTRSIVNINSKDNLLILTPIAFLPIINAKSINVETGFLYGKRWIYNSSSFSFSGGISYNEYSETYEDEDYNKQKLNTYFFGFPFEANIKWFDANKKRYRIYGIIPVGKPTSIGRNYGFKLVGNISKKSYIGIAFVAGLGIHKKY